MMKVLLHCTTIVQGFLFFWSLCACFKAPAVFVPCYSEEIQINCNQIKCIIIIFFFPAGQRHHGLCWCWHGHPWRWWAATLTGAQRAAGDATLPGDRADARGQRAAARPAAETTGCIGGKRDQDIMPEGPVVKLLLRLCHRFRFNFMVYFSCWCSTLTVPFYSRKSWYLKH